MPHAQTISGTGTDHLQKMSNAVAFYRLTNAQRNRISPPNSAASFSLALCLQFASVLGEKRGFL